MSTLEPDTAPRRYRDLREHVEALEAAGLLVTIDQPIDKNTEMHPLVRWQFRGGIAEADRKAFLFTNVVGPSGRRYDMPVVIGALAANPAIYCLGLRCEREAVGELWRRARAAPIPPVAVAHGPCQDVIVEGDALREEGGGLDALPVPISTPGYDAAPYFTMTCCITRDPETGTQNVGTYRAGIKAPDRLGVRMSARPGGAEGYLHWEKYRARGEPMPVAIVVGCPPAIAYTAPQKLAIGEEELAVAGGLAGDAIRVVRARTADLMVPAESELVIEGLVDTDALEPEGPFGESHGHVALEDFNMSMRVTAITRKRNAIMPSIVSQVTPSESSVIKRVAYEPMFLAHLRDQIGIKAVKRVVMHEPLTNIRKVLFVQMERGAPRSEVWRALYAAASLRSDCGKYVIAVNEDIDADDGDAVLWALAYRANPAEDMHILPHRARGHGPKSGTAEAEDSSLLVDATQKGDLPPLALPRREYMEHARDLWDRLGLPSLAPKSPWHGYSLGDWPQRAEEDAQRAVEGNHAENGRRTWARRRAGVRPETPTRDVE